MSKYNTNDPEAVEIRKKIEKLISLNPDIEIYDIISIEEVKRFEAENDIKLPNDYVWFITNVGNGGKWYDGEYQFYPLEKTYFSYEGLPDYKTGREKYSIDILSTGCSYSKGIILRGEHYGEISSDGDGLAFYHPISLHGFKEFYLKWLEEACLGYNNLFFDSRLYGTIEEHLEQYISNPDLELLWSIFYKVNKQCATKQFISDLYTVFVSETDNDNKVMLARILIKSGYEDTFSVLSTIFSPQNYETIVWELHSSICYFKKWLYAEGVMEDAPKYYDMLVEIMKYYETAKERKHFDHCLNMTIMNPKFNENDILGILTSDDEEIVKHLANSVFQNNILNRVGKYIDAAKIKYEKMNENKG